MDMSFFTPAGPGLRPGGAPPDTCSRRASPLTEKGRDLVQTAPDQYGTKKCLRQQAVRDQDRERAMVKSAAYRSSLEAALQQQAVISDAQKKHQAMAELQQYSECYERRMCRMGEAHVDAVAYMMQQNEARAAQEQRLAELNELQAQRFHSALNMVKSQSGAAKARTQEHQQRRAQILKAERDKAQAFSAEMADRAQAQKRRQEELARQELERRKRGPNGLTVDFRHTRLHEGLGTPGPMAVPAVPAPPIPPIPDPVESAEELQHRLVMEKRRKEMAAAEAEFRARERFLAAQAKLRADAQRQAVEAELAELAAQRVLAKKQALAEHRMRLQDQRKQQELLRVFEDNFLPGGTALEDDLAPRPLPSFLQPAAAAAAPLPTSRNRAAAPSGPAPRPSGAMVAAPVDGPGPRWSKSRTAPLGRQPAPVPRTTSQVPAPTPPLKGEMAVQTDPVPLYPLMGANEAPEIQQQPQPQQQAQPLRERPQPDPHRVPTQQVPAPSRQPQPHEHQQSQPQDSQQLRQPDSQSLDDAMSASPTVVSRGPLVRRVAWSESDSRHPRPEESAVSPPPGAARGPADASEHPRPPAGIGAQTRPAADAGERSPLRQQEPPGSADLQDLLDAGDDAVDQWGEEEVDRELARMRRELGLEDADFRSSSSSLTSSMSMPAFLREAAERTAARQASEASGAAAAAAAVAQAKCEALAAVHGPAATSAAPAEARGGDLAAAEERQQRSPLHQGHRQRPSRNEAVTPGADRRGPAAGGAAVAASPADTLDSSILRILNTPSSSATPASTPPSLAAAARGAGLHGSRAARGMRASSALTPGSSMPSDLDLDEVLLLTELDWDELEGLAGTRGASGSGGAGYGGPAAAVWASGGGVCSPSSSSLSGVCGVSDESLRRLVAQGILPPEISTLLAPTPSSTTLSALSDKTPAAAMGAVPPKGRLAPPLASTALSPTASSSLSGLSALLAPYAAGTLGIAVPSLGSLDSLPAASSLSSILAKATASAVPPATLAPPERGGPGPAVVPARGASTGSQQGPVHTVSPAAPATTGLFPIPEGRAVLHTQAPGHSLLPPTSPQLTSTLSSTSTAITDMIAAVHSLAFPSGRESGNAGVPPSRSSFLPEPVRLTLADLNRELLSSAAGQRGRSEVTPLPAGRPGKPGPVIITSLGALPPQPLQPPQRPQQFGTQPPLHQQQQRDQGWLAWNPSGMSSLSSSSVSLSPLSQPQTNARTETGAPAALAAGHKPAPNAGNLLDGVGTDTSSSLSSFSLGKFGRQHQSSAQPHAPEAAAQVATAAPTAQHATVVGDSGLRSPTASCSTAASSPYDMYDREKRRLAELMASVTATLKQSSESVLRAGGLPKAAETPSTAAAGGCRGEIANNETPSLSTPSGSALSTPLSAAPGARGQRPPPGRVASGAFEQASSTPTRAARISGSRSAAAAAVGQFEGLPAEAQDQRGAPDAGTGHRGDLDTSRSTLLSPLSPTSTSLSSLSLPTPETTRDGRGGGGRDGGSQESSPAGSSSVAPSVATPVAQSSTLSGFSSLMASMQPHLSARQRLTAASTAPQAQTATVPLSRLAPPASPAAASFASPALSMPSPPTPPSPVLSDGSFDSVPQTTLSPASTPAGRAPRSVGSAPDPHRSSGRLDSMGPAPANDMRRVAESIAGFLNRRSGSDSSSMEAGQSQQLGSAGRQHSDAADRATEDRNGSGATSARGGISSRNSGSSTDVWASLTGQTLEDALAGLMGQAGTCDDLLRSSLALSNTSLTSILEEPPSTPRGDLGSGTEESGHATPVATPVATQHGPTVGPARLVAEGARMCAADTAATGPESSRDAGSCNAPSVVGDGLSHLSTVEQEEEEQKEQSLVLGQRSSGELLAEVDAVLMQAISHGSASASQPPPPSPPSAAAPALGAPSPLSADSSVLSAAQQEPASQSDVRSSADSAEFGSIMSGLLKDIQRGLLALQAVDPQPQPQRPEEEEQQPQQQEDGEGPRSQLATEASCGSQGAEPLDADGCEAVGEASGIRQHVAETAAVSGLMKDLGRLLLDTGINWSESEDDEEHPQRAAAAGGARAETRARSGGSGSGYAASLAEHQRALGLDVGSVLQTKAVREGSSPDSDDTIQQQRRGLLSLPTFSRGFEDTPSATGQPFAAASVLPANATPVPAQLPPVPHLRASPLEDDAAALQVASPNPGSPSMAAMADTDSGAYSFLQTPRASTARSRMPPSVQSGGDSLGASSSDSTVSAASSLESLAEAMSGYPLFGGAAHSPLHSPSGPSGAGSASGSQAGSEGANGEDSSGNGGTGARDAEDQAAWQPLPIQYEPLQPASPRPPLTADQEPWQGAWDPPSPSPVALRANRFETPPIQERLDSEDIKLTQEGEAAEAAWTSGAIAGGSVSSGTGGVASGIPASAGLSEPWWRGAAEGVQSSSQWNPAAHGTHLQFQPMSDRPLAAGPVSGDNSPGSPPAQQRHVLASRLGLRPPLLDILGGNEGKGDASRSDATGGEAKGKILPQAPSLDVPVAESENYEESPPVGGTIRRRSGGGNAAVVAGAYAGALSEEQLAGLLLWTVSDFFSSPGSSRGGSESGSPGDF